MPAAFFFGVLLTFGRLKQDGEFVVLMAAGCGLGRLLDPGPRSGGDHDRDRGGLVLGFVNPHAHYAYRVLKHTVAQASLSAAVLEGTFIQADGLTFFAEHSAVRPTGLELDRVFVHEQGEEGETIVVTGRNGLLARSATEGRPVLMLEKGVRAEIAADGTRPRRSPSATSAGRSTPRPIDFRARGRDQKELTLTELWHARAARDARIQRRHSAEIGAELHSRLVLILSVPSARPSRSAACSAGPVRSRRGGIVVGLLILIVYYEALNFGDAMAKRELLAPVFGLWLPFALLLVGPAGYLLLARAPRPVTTIFGRAPRAAARAAA